MVFILPWPLGPILTTINLGSGTAGDGGGTGFSLKETPGQGYVARKLRREWREALDARQLAAGIAFAERTAAMAAKYVNLKHVPRVATWCPVHRRVDTCR